MSEQGTASQQLSPNRDGAAFGDKRRKRRLDVAAALKSAALTALIAAGMFSLLIGFRTDQTAGPLDLAPRPMLLAVVVAIVFVGRFLLVLAWNAGLDAAVSHRPSPPRSGLVSRASAPGLDRRCSALPC
jgi:hypothetical protein